MIGLEDVVTHLEGAGVIGEVWIDGSLLTQKIDPKDVDILLYVQADFYNRASPEQRAAMDWITSDLQPTHKVDSYLELHHDRTDPKYWESEWWRAYWLRQFGFSRETDPKGIALLTLSGGTMP